MSDGLCHSIYQQNPFFWPSLQLERLIRSLSGTILLTFFHGCFSSPLHQASFNLLTCLCGWYSRAGEKMWANSQLVEQGRKALKDLKAKKKCMDGMDECTQWELNPHLHAAQHSSLTMWQCVPKCAFTLKSGNYIPQQTGLHPGSHWPAEVLPSLPFSLMSLI